MADIESNINLNIDTSAALANIRALQREISLFHSSMSKGGAAASARSAELQQSLINSINASGKFSASVRTIQSTTEAFTTSLERNKLSMGEYFRYAAGASKTFGKNFSAEFETINKVARERVKDLQTQYIKLGRDANGAMRSIAIRPMALDMDDFGTKSAIAAQKLQLFNQLVNQGSTSLLNWGKNTQWAGRQLMVGFSIPLGIAGAMAAREFMKLEEQSLRFRRVYGDSFTPTDEADQMAKQVQDLALEFTKYGATVEQTMAIAADAAAMGLQGQALTAQVSEATRLAVLGGVEQQEALKTTISLTDAFGVSTEELTNKTNFLNAVENQTVTSIEDLTIAIPKAGPVIQQLGGDVEDLAFFLTAMKEGGINASEGANALKSGLASLINPTAKASEMLAGFGIDIQGIVNANKGDVKGIVIDFATALDTLDPLNRAQAIEQLFGKFQFARLSTLFQNVIAQGSQANRVLELSQQTTGELAALADRELARLEESPMYKFKAAVEEFKAAIAPIGEIFLKLVTPLINFGTDILKSFNQLDDRIKSTVTGIIAVVGGILPVLIMGIGLFANFVASGIKGFFAMKNALSNFAGFLKRSATDTQYLGSQTEYMSQQQLEAAAVAASLEQSHNRLTQQFTSEAGAVRDLTLAYEQAIASGQQFSGIPMRPGQPFQGQGPTREAFGAMLPTIMQAGDRDVERSHLTGAFNKNSNVFKAAIDASPDAMQLKELLKLYPKSIEVHSNLVAELPRLLNQGLKKGIERADFARLWQSREGKLRVAARLGGANDKDPQIQAALSSMEEEISQRAQELGLATENQKITDKELTQATKEVIQKYKKMGGSAEVAAKALDAAAAQAGQVRINLSKAQIEAGLAKGIFEQKGKSIYFQGAEVAREGRPSNRTPRGMPSYTSRGKLSTVNADLLFEMMAGAGIDMEGAPAGGGLSPEEKARRTAERKFAKQNPDWEKKFASARSEATRTRLLEQKEAALRETINRSLAAQAAAQRRKEQKANETAVLAQQEAALAQQNVNERRGGRFSRMIRGVGGMMSPGRIAMGAGAVGGIAMMASGMGGAVGDVAGQIATPMMMISSVAGALSMIPGPAGIVVGALAALGIGIFAIKAAFDDAQRSAEKYAYATKASTANIEGLAAATGKVTASSARDKQREEALNAIQKNEERATMAQSYLESETGKATVDAVGKALESGNVKSAANNLANQLATAMAEGAVSRVEAGYIAQEIGKQLGDSSFAMRVSGTLDSFVGPNGEDLFKDPIGVRVEILKDSQKDINLSAQQIEGDFKNIGDAFTEAFDISGDMGWLKAIGLATGVGSVIAPIITGVGQLQELGTQTAAFASNLAIGAQQTQMMIDSLDLEYQKRIEVAKAAGDAVEAERLTTEYIQGRQKLLDQNTKMYKDAAKAYKDLDTTAKTGVISSLEEQIKTLYKDSPLAAQAQATINQINDMTDNGSQTELIIKTALATGDIDPTTVASVMNLVKNGGGEVTLTANLITQLGAADADRLFQLVALSGDEEKATEFMVSVRDQDPATTQTILNTLETLGKYGQEYAVKYAIEAGTGETLRIANELATLDSFFPNGQANYQAIIDFIVDDEGIKMSQDQLEYFKSLPPEEAKVYASTFLSIIETIDANTSEGRQRIRDWLKENKLTSEFATGSTIGGKEFKIDYLAAQQRMAGDMAKSAAKLSIASAADAEGGADTTGGADKDPTSILDNVVQKIKNVKNAAMGLTDTWRSSMDALMAFAKSGFSGFAGIENQLRGLGAGEDAISMITGMSKDDWDKYKNELFVFDSAGNIVGITQQFNALNVALREIKLGEFFSQQQKTVEGFKFQQAAVTKLVAAGMSYAQALEVVKDTELARAIATGASADEMAKLTEKTKEATKAQQDYNAALAVANKVEANVNRQNLVERLARDNTLTQAQIEAILGDENLARLYLDPTIDPNLLQDALDDAEAAADLQVSVDRLTITGMEKLFNDGFSKAMDAFAAEEKAIELRFNAQTKPFEDAIKFARNQISDITNAPGGLDDLNAELERIAAVEEDINDKYRARFSALDEIAAANDRIAQQQKGQLTLADALSRGDLAAAAAAAQEIRSQNASNAIADERAALEKQQELELANIRVSMGLTREEIEKRIRDLRAQILQIEEEIIEPAEYQIELLTRQEELEKESLRVLGLSKGEWEAIKNTVDLARINSDQYREALQLALDVVDDIKAAWAEIEKPKQTVHTIIERRVQEGTPSAVGTSASSGPGGGGTDVSQVPGGQTPQQIAAAAKAQTVIDQNNNWKAAVKDLMKIGKSIVELPPGRFSGVQLAGLIQKYNKQVDVANKLRFGNAKTGTPNLNYWNDGGERAYKSGRLSDWVRSDKRYYASGGFVASGLGALGTDTIPAMLTPGEFVIKRQSVQDFGVDRLKAINSGTYNDGSVYNYGINVNVKSDANPDEIARTVMAQIKRIDSQRIRGNRF